MLVPMMVATPAAQLVSCNRERRDNSVEPIRVMALPRSDLHEKGIVRLEAVPPGTRHHDDEERRSYKQASEGSQMTMKLVSDLEVSFAKRPRPEGSAR